MRVSKWCTLGRGGGKEACLEDLETIFCLLSWETGDFDSSPLWTGLDRQDGRDSLTA